jgi:transposase
MKSILLNNQMSKITIPFEVLHKLYVDKNYTQKEVAKKLNISIDTVRRNLKEYGIASKQQGIWNRNPRIEFSISQLEVIQGALLGDGCLYKNKKARNAIFCYSSKSLQHVKFVNDYLSNFITKEGIKNYSRLDKRTNKVYSGYRIRTQLNEVLTELYNIWYPNKKIIPTDLKLTPLICLLWYIGDGCLMNGNRSQNIKLATHCFTYSDINNILLPQLTEFEARAIQTEKIGQYYIYIPRRKVKAFLSYIGDCPFEDYKYKWDYKEYKKGEPRNHTSKESIFVKLYKEGWSYYKIAKFHNLSPGVVRHYLIKNKIYKQI